MKFGDHDREEVFTTGHKKKNNPFAALIAQFKCDQAEQQADDEDESGEGAASQKLEDFFGKKAFDADENQPDKPKFNFDFSSITKNRLYIGIACLVGALLIGLVFVPMSAHLASIKTVTVLRASKDIPVGTKLTAEMLNQVEISAQNVPETVVLDAEQAVGKYADKDIVTDENILSTKLVDVPPIGEEYLTELPNGDLAVSVSVKSFASGLSGKLLPGDVVSIYANMTTANEYDYRSTLVSELYYVEVLAVTNEEIGDTDKGAEPDPENPDEQKDTLPTTVTLRCINLEQAQVLIGLEANSTIHLALICRDNENYKKQLLDAQKNYFIILAQQEALALMQQQSQLPGTSTVPGDSTASSQSTSSTPTESSKPAKDVTSSKGAKS